MTLTMYVVTNNPSDFPDHVVVRKHYVGPVERVVDPDPMIVAPELDVARELLHAVVPGLHVIPRSRHDDPVIVETWI